MQYRVSPAVCPRTTEAMGEAVAARRAKGPQRRAPAGRHLIRAGKELTAVLPHLLQVLQPQREEMKCPGPCMARGPLRAHEKTQREGGGESEADGEGEADGSGKERERGRGTLHCSLSPWKVAPSCAISFLMILAWSPLLPRTAPSVISYTPRAMPAVSSALNAAAETSPAKVMWEIAPGASPAEGPSQEEVGAVQQHRRVMVQLAAT